MDCLATPELPSEHLFLEDTSDLDPPLSHLLATLKGKAILVTGSTSGLGRCIALACAQAQCRGVMICGRDARRGAAVVQSIKEANPYCDVGFVQGDLAEGEAIADSVVAAAVALFGTVDGLVNSAAVCFPRGTLESTSTELWDRIMATNLRAPFLLTQRVAKHMQEHRVRGSIVNIGSCCAYGGIDGHKMADHDCVFP